MHITIRKVSGQRTILTLEDLDELTVYDAKQLIEIEWEDLDADRMILIFRGTILSDSKALSTYGLKDGSTLILTMKKDKPAPAQPASAAPVARPAPSRTASSNVPRPGARPAPRNHLIPPHMQEMMQNPFMQQMMDNMLSNPEFLEMIMNNNPQMQALMNQNPEIRALMRDPDTMRQAMQMMRDPEAMQQALQNQDRMMANVSNMPGGFNAIARAYNQYQAPMENAMLPQHQQDETNISEVDRSNGPVSQAMPNPFAQSSQNSQAAPRAQNVPATPPSMFPFFPNSNPTTPLRESAPSPPGFVPSMLNFPSFTFNPAPPRQNAAPQPYAQQMSYLQQRGYTNVEENREALEETEGNLELAIAILIANREDED